MNKALAAFVVMFLIAVLILGTFTLFSMGNLFSLHPVSLFIIAFFYLILVGCVVYGIRSLLPVFMKKG